MYAFLNWAYHCAGMIESERDSWGISNMLVCWMVRGQGPNTFNSYMERVKKSDYSASMAHCFEEAKDSSPIFAACLWNFVEVARELLKVEPSCIRRLNIDGQTPLTVGYTSTRREVADFLRDSGAEREMSGVIRPAVTSTSS
jgi:hypothetical protein